MKRSIWTMLMIAMLTAVLSACSGGGTTTLTPSTTVSGIAAAGAPIIGFAYLKDSAGTSMGPITIAADGSFSFDVTGLTAPFYLQAQGAAGGQSFTLHSVSVGTGTANINPLTNLVVSQATGGKDPAAVFSDPTKVTVNQASVDAAITAIQTALAPLLAAANVSATVNPLTGSYVANPTTNKLDALFDAVSITVTPPASAGASSTVSVTDKTGGAILNSTVTTITTSTASNVSTVLQTSTDSQAISSFLQTFATTVSSKGTNLATTDLDKYYYGTDSTYGLDEGYSRTQTIQELVMGLTGNILLVRGQITKIGNFSILNDLTTSAIFSGKGFNKVYRILADFYFQDGSYGAPKGMTVVQVTPGGPWQFIGNGFKTYVEIEPYANQITTTSGSVVYKTGMFIDLEDQGNHGVNSASFEGPGLPAGGITFSKAATGDASNTVLALDSQFRGYPIAGSTWSQYEMTDTQIGKVVAGIAGQGQYTLKFYSETTAPTDRTAGLMQTLHPIIGATPVSNATLASATAATYFATAKISNFTQTLSGFLALLSSSTSIPFTYTLPKAYNPSWMQSSIHLWDNNGANNSNTEKNLALNATSSSMIGLKLTYTPTYGFLVMTSEDPSHSLFQAIALLQ